MNNDVKNILLVRTDRIGDVVLTLPLAGLIKKHYPNCKVSFLVRNYTKDILINHPFVDHIVVLNEEKGNAKIFSNLELISEKKYDTCIIVNPTFKISLILFLSGIRKRIGTGYRWYSWLFNEKVFEHRKYAEKHELEFNVSMLRKIGINESINENNVEYNLQVNKESLIYVEKVLSDENIDNAKPLIIIHPGSGGSSIDLPITKFVELLEKLEQEEVQIIITGNDQEKDICNRLVISKSIKNFAGKFNLAQLTALIKKADIFISNSTGPIHIAAALGKFSIGFYPKILSCSKERWGPYSPNKLVYVPEIDCSNCDRQQCERLNCMENIEIEKVFSDIKKVLAKIKEMELR
jgi:lipopolysaccharide heptosyltransferase II